MDHIRGAPNHPQTQGKIERWHRMPKNRILLENYYLPGALEEAAVTFVVRSNHSRYQKSLGNLTPADVYLDRSNSILKDKEKTKERTLKTAMLVQSRARSLNKISQPDGPDRCQLSRTTSFDDGQAVTDANCPLRIPAGKDAVALVA